jgi:hypothetical protein
MTAPDSSEACQHGIWRSRFVYIILLSMTLSARMQRCTTPFQVYICRVATKAVYYQGFGLLHGPTAIGTSQLFFCCKFLVVGPTQNNIGDNADTFHDDSIGLRQEQWREWTKRCCKALNSIHIWLGRSSWLGFYTEPIIFWLPAPFLLPPYTCSSPSEKSLPRPSIPYIIDTQLLWVRLYECCNSMQTERIANVHRFGIQCIRVRDAGADSPPP